MTDSNKKYRSRLIGFIVISIIEETVIGLIAFLIILLVVPFLLVPGIIAIVVGLVLFTIVKIYYYWTSSSIPVEDPIIGQEAVAIQDFQKVSETEWTGEVRFKGEIWRAKSNRAIMVNKKVQVTKIDGLSLLVKTSSDADTL